MHRSSTRFPQTFAFAILAALATLAGGLQAQAKAPLLFRVFLNDGGSLVSYGEFARVGGGVMVPVPLGDVTASPQLHVTTIPDAKVDWTATDAYTAAVRGKHYAETRGEDDYALLTGQVTLALNDIAATADPKRRLAMAQEARGNLAAWPSQNYGFKAAEVAQLVTIFDDVIAEMKVDAGEGRIDLALVAMTLPPPAVALMPAPDVQSSLELAYQAAMLSADAAERTALLRALTSVLAYTPTGSTWAPALRARASSALAVELKADRAYEGLVRSTMAGATARAARGDVRGLQGIIARALRSDDALGRRRPGEMAGLLATLDLKLKEAQRVRLALDGLALRQAEIRAYESRIGAPLERIRGFRKWLDSIRELAGPDPKFLRPLEDRAALAIGELAAAQPTADVTAAHQMLTASLHMTRQAAALRRAAVSSNDINIARDASSAAAGALTLGERALEELRGLKR